MYFASRGAIVVVLVAFVGTLSGCALAGKVSDFLFGSPDTGSEQKSDAEKVLDTGVSLGGPIGAACSVALGGINLIQMLRARRNKAGLVGIVQGLDNSLAKGSAQSVTKDELYKAISLALESGADIGYMEDVIRKIKAENRLP